MKHIGELIPATLPFSSLKTYKFLFYKTFNNESGHKLLSGIKFKFYQSHIIKTEIIRIFE